MGVFVPIMAGHEDAGVMTGHIGTNTPKFVPDRRLTLLKRGCVRSEKLQNESFPNFSNFRPEFCPEFLLRIFPEFFEDFSCFASWETETSKNSPKSPPFFNVNCQANTKKIFTKFFWRAGKVIKAVQIRVGLELADKRDDCA